MSLPESITADNGGEFSARGVDARAYLHHVKLDFIRPGKPVGNSFIESFDGKRRDECLNSEVLLGIADAREKVESWRHDYNSLSAQLRCKSVSDRLRGSHLAIKNRPS